MPTIPIVRDVPIIAPRTICTLGYAKLTQADVLALMRANPDAILVDTRRTPYSRVHAGFNMPTLHELLGTRYLSPSRELGNQSGGHGWAPPSGMPAAIEWLMKLQPHLDAANRFPIFMCAESDHRHCHRGWQDGVAPLALSLWDGWNPEILHIWSDGNTTTPPKPRKGTPAPAVNVPGTQGTLF